ncbi:hypothetical protein ACWDUL_02450 [Nocardia niigatensis]
MTTASDTPGGALRLLAAILTRYDTLDAFLAQLHRELDDPTQEIPRITADTQYPTYPQVTLH